MQSLVNIIKIYSSVRNNAEFYGGKRHEIFISENILAVVYRTYERSPQKKQENQGKFPPGISKELMESGKR